MDNIMSMNENKKNEQASESSLKKDVAKVAYEAVDAVLTSVVSAKLYQKIASKVANGVDPAKIKKASGVFGAGICSGLLLTSDFIPTLAQALDRAWAKRDAKNAPAEEVAEETVEEIAEEPVQETEAEEVTVEEIVEEVVEEIPVVEEPVEVTEAVATMAASEEQEEEDEEEGSFGFSTAGLEFFDAMEKPEEYAALVEQENAGEIQIVARYRRSFQSRLIQSQGEVQSYYSTIKNKLLSYKGVKARTSWGNESFNKGRNYIAKVNAKSKTLYLYLAINPATLGEDSKYNFEDVSSKKKYENVPVLIKIKGPRKLNYALELIDSICNTQMALPEVKNFEEVDYTVEYRSTEELVVDGLVKKMVAGVPVAAFDTTVEPTPTEVDVTVASV